jgi:hypothetical protein
MQQGKNWIFPKETGWYLVGKPVLLRLSLAGNLEKPLMSLYGTEWRESGYGLGDLKCSRVKTGFCRKRYRQTGSSETLISWKSGKPL